MQECTKCQGEIYTFITGVIFNLCRRLGIKIAYRSVDIICYLFYIFIKNFKIITEELYNNKSKTIYGPPT